MMLKLNRQIECTSKLDPELVIDKIVRKLVENKYDVNTMNETSVSFFESSGIRFRSDPAQINEGLFEITQLGNKTVIKLNYSMSFVPQLIFLCFLVVFGIFVDMNGLYYLGGFLLVTSVFYYYNLQNKAKQLMLGL